MDSQTGWPALVATLRVRPGEAEDNKGNGLLTQGDAMLRYATHRWPWALGCNRFAVEDGVASGDVGALDGAEGRRVATSVRGREELPFTHDHVAARCAVPP